MKRFADKFNFLIIQLSALFISRIALAQEGAEQVAKETVQEMLSTQNIQAVATEQWDTAKNLIDMIMEFFIVKNMVEFRDITQI